jgi:hypothetical protein
MKVSGSFQNAKLLWRMKADSSKFAGADKAKAALAALR